jgi:hypothetical protein
VGREMKESKKKKEMSRLWGRMKEPEKLTVVNKT